MLDRAQRRSGGTISSNPATVRVLATSEGDAVPATGSVQSVQEAEVTLPRQRLEQLWKPETLEALAQAYWAYTTKLFLHLVRVVYAPDSTTVVLFSRRIPLLRFHAPQYETEEDGTGGSVTWPIDRGLLVAREGRGKGALRVSIERCDGDEEEATRGFVELIAKVEVENFYPGIRGRGRFARFGAWFYAQTQLRIHVIVCNAYLRSLPRLDFPDIDRTGMPSDQRARSGAA
jgi:hypothetical protein